jgi:hypothetical protein
MGEVMDRELEVEELVHDVHVDVRRALDARTHALGGAAPIHEQISLLATAIIRVIVAERYRNRDQKPACSVGNIDEVLSLPPATRVFSSGAVAVQSSSPASLLFAGRTYVDIEKVAVAIDEARRPDSRCRRDEYMRAATAEECGCAECHRTLEIIDAVRRLAKR